MKHKCEDCKHCDIKTIKWHYVDEVLPNEPGEYLVTYHPCYWDSVDFDTIKVGMDTFRGKTAWAKKKFQKVIAWARMPLPYGTTGGNGTVVLRG